MITSQGFDTPVSRAPQKGYRTLKSGLLWIHFNVFKWCMALLGQEEKSDKVHKLVKVSAQKAGNSCIAGSTLAVNIVYQRHGEFGVIHHRAEDLHSFGHVFFI